MATYKTVENLGADTTKSNYYRTACDAINKTRKTNGHICSDNAIEKMGIETGIDASECREYVEMVISDADDAEWNEQQ